MECVTRTVLAFAVLATACGGTRSGLDGNQRVVALTPAELTTECQFIHDAYPVRAIMCDINNQFMIGAADVAQCISQQQDFAMRNPACTVTVAQLEACDADTWDEPDAYYCLAMPVKPTSCAPLQTAECSN